jgi:hypothetical protein
MKVKVFTAKRKTMHWNRPRLSALWMRCGLINPVCTPHTHTRNTPPHCKSALYGPRRDIIVRWACSARAPWLFAKQLDRGQRQSDPQITRDPKQAPKHTGLYEASDAPNWCTHALDRINKGRPAKHRRRFRRREVFAERRSGLSPRWRSEKWTRL